MYHHIIYTQYKTVHTGKKKYREFCIRFIIFAYKQTTNFSDFAINLKLKKKTNPNDPSCLCIALLAFMYTWQGYPTVFYIQFHVYTLYNVHAVHGRTRTFNTHKKYK